MTYYLKFLYHNTVIGHFLMYPIKRFYNIFILWLLPDKIYIKKKFKASFGYNLNLNEPKTLNEKIQWLKLNDRSPLHTLCADKYLVRDYVRRKIGEKYLVPLILQTTYSSQISQNNLPDYPVIIKTNNDSGTHFFIRNKHDPNIDWIELRNKLQKSLKNNYYRKTKEWQYKNIVPRIIVEKLLLDPKGQIPEDYKVHVINHKVEMISVDLGRGTDKHSRNWYNTLWQKAPFKWSSYYNNKYTDPIDVTIKPPRRLRDMIDLSCILAFPFCYARVDWYEVEGNLYFGEITFHHDGGYAPIIPAEWDKIFGDKLKLPK